MNCLSVISFLYEPEFICLHTIKRFQILLIIISTQRKGSLCFMEYQPLQVI